jgi:ribosomal-protein-alanine N-acetyltransferase
MKRPARPSFTTRRLVVRLVEKSDLSALLEVNGDDEVFRYTPRSAWKSPADGKAWFSRIMKHRKSGATIQFVIVLKENSRPVGTMAVFHFDEDVGSAEIGYILGRDHWGQGLMTELLSAFVRYGFGTLGLKRLYAELDPRNAGSVKVLERVGFTREGLRRRDYFCKGEITDTALYAMLSRDPRPKVRM